MQVTTQNLNYPNEDGKTTDYIFETYKQEDKDPIFVVRNDPKNQGQKFGQDREDRDFITGEQAKYIQKEHGLEPEQIELYQERPDGDFDKVTFGEKANSKGELVWTEEEREKITPQELERTTVDYEHRQTSDQKLDEMYEQDGTVLTEAIPDNFTNFDKKQEDQQQEMARTQEQQRAKNQEISR